jgi:hypothetical protein
MYGSWKQPNKRGNNNLHIREYWQLREIQAVLTTYFLVTTQLQKKKKNLHNYTRAITLKQFKAEQFSLVRPTSCVSLLWPSTAWRQRALSTSL